MPVAGDFAAADSPEHRFQLQLGKIRKVAVWMAKHHLDIEPIFAATDGLRALWHRAHYQRKKRALADGPWQEYARVDRQPAP